MPTNKSGASATDHNQAQPQAVRLPHAILERDSRVNKARKIIAMIGEERFKSARRILEIGCGSGVIASTLAELGAQGVRMYAVDVVDNRTDTSGYEFQTVAGTELPFDDDYFDIVITNHVIEHVGAASDQIAHLREIKRTTAADGIVYLAVPNKWGLVEPHYRLPFLSWLPQAASDRYVRLMRRGTHYDCLPLSFSGARSLFDTVEFAGKDVTIRALYATLAIEMGDSALARLCNKYMPDWIPRAAMALMPTYVFLLNPGKQ